MAKHLINRNITYIPADRSIDEALRLMKSDNISSLLVVDEKDMVVGIITERDILRNLTTIELADKTSKPARVLMSRPVKVTRVDSIIEDIHYLSAKYSYRHFPVVVEADNFHISNFLGFITATDFFKYALDKMRHAKAKKAG